MGTCYGTVHYKRTKAFSIFQTELSTGFRLAWLVFQVFLVPLLSHCYLRLISATQQFAWPRPSRLRSWIDSCLFVCCYMAAGWSAGYTDSLEEADEDLCPWCDDMSVELPVLSASSPPADELVSQGWWRRPGRSSRSWGRMRRQPRISSWHSGDTSRRKLTSALQICSSFSKGMSPWTMS